MGQLFQLILDNLYKLWPFRVVDADEQGLRFNPNGTISLLKPGFHVFLPGLQRIETLNVVYQQLDCGIQNMETKDGISVSISFNVGYTVANAAQQIIQYYNFDHTLKLLTRGRVGELIHCYTYVELQQRLLEISNELLSTLRKEMAGSGVRIKDVRADDFGKSKMYRFLTTSGEVSPPVMG